MSLSQRQVDAIAALLEHERTDDASAACGVPARTIRRWRLEVPEFATALERARRKGLERALEGLLGSVGKATRTLVAVMEDPSAPPGARVSAARAVIENALRAGELSALESRIRELEGAVELGAGEMLQ